MGKRTRREFTDEFKAEAVRLVGESENSVGQIPEAGYGKIGKTALTPRRPA